MLISHSNIKQFLYSIISLLFPFCLIAQDEKPSKEKQTIYIEGNETLIKTTVLSSRTAINPKKDLTYYWCTSNKIMETQGGYEGKLLHGDYTVFYHSNNNLKEKGKFKNGLKNGEWTTWYENGKIASITHWKSGKLHNSLKAFDNSGNSTGEKRYKNGVEVPLKKSFLHNLFSKKKASPKEQDKKSPNT
jgi:antitoxin component YwqK of YwqJK toxin-antitoxin module